MNILNSVNKLYVERAVVSPLLSQEQFFQLSFCLFCSTSISFFFFFLSITFPWLLLFFFPPWVSLFAVRTAAEYNERVNWFSIQPHQMDIFSNQSQLKAPPTYLASFSHSHLPCLHTAAHTVSPIRESELLYTWSHTHAHTQRVGLHAAVLFSMGVFLHGMCGNGMESKGKTLWRHCVFIYVCACLLWSSFKEKVECVCLSFGNLAPGIFM